MRTNPHARRKRARIIGGLAVLGALLGACDRRGPAAYPKASLILVSVDTLRADHLGCYGYQRPTSPGLDRIAAESILFENVIAQSTWTTPSHAALMTSRYPTELGLGTWPDPGMIPDRFPTLAEVLARDGFRNHALTESGWMNGKFGFSRGFEEYDDRGGHFRAIIPRAEMRLEELKDQRFFLFLHTYDVHWYEPPATLWRPFVRPYGGDLRPSAELRRNIQMHGNREWIDSLGHDDIRYIVDLYDASIRNVDIYLTRLATKLRDQGIWDRVVFVVTSDHGEEFLEHGRTGHGYSAHDEQIRLPLIVHLPGGVLGGTRIREQVRSIDIMPTLLELLGVSGPLPEMRGSSLVPLFRGPRKPRAAFTDRGHAPEVSVRSPRWKVILNPKTEKYRMYDLEADPGELADCADRRPAQGLAQLEALRAWLAGLERPDEPAPSVSLTDEDRKRIEALGYVEGKDRDE